VDLAYDHVVPAGLNPEVLGVGTVFVHRTYYTFPLVGADLGDEGAALAEADTKVDEAGAVFAMVAILRWAQRVVSHFFSS